MPLEIHAMEQAQSHDGIKSINDTPNLIEIIVMTKV